MKAHFLFLLLMTLVMKLKADGNSFCGPIPATCNPASVNTGGGMTYFELNQISNASTNNNGTGYQDFTCSDSTWLNQADSYTVEAITGQTYGEYIRVWIDFSDDGSFDSTEMIYDGPLTVYSHYGITTIPVAGLTGTPLRMRVGSETEGFPPPDGCDDVQYGQYEDYTVYLNGPTGTNQPGYDHSVLISPNPFQTTATISFPARAGMVYFKICNSMGAPVRTEKIKVSPEHEIIIERKNLVDGMYFYELRSTNYELIGSGKFIVD